MLMYVDTADGYKYRSLRRAYRQISKIESISLLLSLFKSHYFILHLRPLLRDLRHCGHFQLVGRVILWAGLKAGNEKNLAADRTDLLL